MSSPQILDGAMGTELQNRGISIPLQLWSANANIEHPQIVIYPNLATSDFDNEYLTIIDKSDFKNSISKLCDYKPDVIGFCCGSTPENINEITKLINGRKEI